LDLGNDEVAQHIDILGFHQGDHIIWARGCVGSNDPLDFGGFSRDFPGGSCGALNKYIGANRHTITPFNPIKYIKPYRISSLKANDSQPLSDKHNPSFEM
jgi:hypothetical protein